VGLLPQSACSGSAEEDEGGVSPTETTRQPVVEFTPVFADVTRETGLDFVHFNGMSGELFLPEIMGAGGALFDYDGDGDLDLYVVQGGMLPPAASVDTAIFPPVRSNPTDRLYRNDLRAAPVIDVDRRGELHFTEVTRESGLESTGYGMGAVAGDYNRDGWVDLYVTNFGSNKLWRNNGDGTFADVTDAAGVDDPRWSVPAAFFDFDRDGWLDLYVGNYADFRFASRKECFSPSGRRDYCGPLAYDSVPDRLFHNRGDGTFEDVTLRSGLREAWGYALGVTVVDFNQDGWLDLYVANDSMENQLWTNLRDGTFANQAQLAGCAVNESGKAEASMGVDVGDIDGDGDEDLFMTHINQESNTLYLNDGTGTFTDETIASGLGFPSWNNTGFGTVFMDYDNDARLDIVVVNGAVKAIESQVQEGSALPLRQSNQLYRGLGTGRFEDVSGSGGSAFALAEVSRGLAPGDLDNDGDTDLVLFNNAGPVRVLLNRVGQDQHWMGLRLQADAGRGSAIGSWVALLSDGQEIQWRRVKRGGSYASSGDPRLIFGLGSSSAPLAVRVHWANGRVEEWRKLERDRYTTLEEGRGILIGQLAR